MPFRCGAGEFDMRHRGFTLIELLVVLAALALLLGLAVPRYIEHVDRTREAVLRQNLATMRDAIDKFQADRGRLPSELQELVRERYLKALPEDPLTLRSDSWVAVSPISGATGTTGQVADVRSGAPGQARDGSSYATW
jgi:general secretion pathway protein G